MRNRNAKSQGAKPQEESLLPTPEASADQLDAIFYFIHKRYSDSNGTAPNLSTFLITKGDVVFTESIQHVQIEKRPEERTLFILTPVVPREEMESRRIFLLNAFGELIIKLQKEAYLQVREMLLRVTDEEGQQALLEAFEQYKASLVAKSSDSST